MLSEGLDASATVPARIAMIDGLPGGDTPNALNDRENMPAPSLVGKDADA